MRGGFEGTGFIGVTLWDGTPWLLSVKYIVGVSDHNKGSKVSRLILRGEGVIYTKDSKAEILRYIQEERGVKVGD